MNKLLRHFFLSELRKSLDCQCPNRVPRSGNAGNRINCQTVYIDNGSDPYLLVRRLEGTTLHCLQWSGSTFETPTTIQIDQLNPDDLSVTHFYGLSEVQYRGVDHYLFGRLLRLPYLKISLIRAIESIDQYFFNKKKLITKQRIDLLRLLLARRLEGQSTENVIGLMTALYSIKWLFHPDRTTQQAKIRFYLDSLVDTGELRLQQHEYILTGRALQAIETYEEQERKHTESIKAQRAMMWLTVAIVLLTAAQADLISFPTLIDFTK